MSTNPPTRMLTLEAPQKIWNKIPRLD